jgi:hypothetical protein
MGRSLDAVELLLRRVVDSAESEQEGARNPPKRCRTYWETKFRKKGSTVAEVETEQNGSKTQKPLWQSFI